MTIRTVLLPIPVNDPKESVMESAVRAAEVAKAHLVGLAIDRGGDGGGRAAALAEHTSSARQAQALVKAAESQSDAGSGGRDELKDRFAALCREHGVAFDDEAEPDAGKLPSATWSRAQGAVEAVVEAQSPTFDLTVAGSTAVGRIERKIAERSLRSAGRPVLLSPVRSSGGLDGTVLVAWDGSPTCWRTVAAAMPFLQHASRVAVATVADRGATADQDKLVRYLAWYGVDAQARVVDSGVRKVADEILTEATDTGANLLVMGAYSRSPWREAVFGGVTRSVLDRVASTPVLMAH